MLNISYLSFLTYLLNILCLSYFTNMILLLTCQSCILGALSMTRCPLPQTAVLLSPDPPTFSPVASGDQNSANVYPCACRKRRLIMGYKPSYTTGLLYAWSSCMQWGIWVWTVGHWVVLVQVIYCSKGGWVHFLKEPTASLRGDHELQPQSYAGFSRN